MRRAKKDPIARQSWRSLRLNLGESDTVTKRERLVERDEWIRAAELPQASDEGARVFGIDLGGTRSLSSVACYWLDTGRLDTISAIGGIPDPVTRGEQDGHPMLYSSAIEDGGLIIHENRRLPDVPSLMRYALQEFGVPALVVSDRYRKGETEDSLRDFDLEIYYSHFGSAEGAECVARWRKCLSEDRVRPVPRRLLDYAIDEARVRVTVTSDTVLELRKDTEVRDDPVAASVLAVGFGDKLRDHLRRVAPPQFFRPVMPRRPNQKKTGWQRYLSPEDHAAWVRLSRRLRKKYPACQRCNRSPPAVYRLHLHHLDPPSKGFPILCDEDRLEVLCNECHSYEHAPPEKKRYLEFLARRWSPIPRA